jgi:hypothetical protein
MKGFGTAKPVPLAAKSVPKIVGNTNPYQKLSVIDDRDGGNASKAALG